MIRASLCGLRVTYNRGHTVFGAGEGGRMFEQTFKNIDDVLWKEAGCTTELDYVEQTSWMLFLKYLDDLERERADRAEHCRPGAWLDPWRCRA